MANLYDRAKEQDIADPTYLIPSPKNNNNEAGKTRPLSSLSAEEVAVVFSRTFGGMDWPRGLAGVNGAALVFWTDDDLREAGVSAKEVRTSLLQGVRRFQTEGVAQSLLETTPPPPPPPPATSATPVTVTLEHTSGAVTTLAADEMQVRRDTGTGAIHVTGLASTSTAGATGTTAAVASATGGGEAPSAAPRREAYATMLTSDSFLPGAQALLASLRTMQATLPAAARRPVVLMVTAAVSAAVRTKLHKPGSLADEVVVVDSIALPPPPSADAAAAAAHVASWSDTYTKLQIWTLDQPARGGYEAVVYVDADAVVLEDISDVFERVGQSEPRQPFVAAPDVFPPDRFNAGVVGIVPSSATFDDMAGKLSSLPTHDGGDTGFLNSFFSDWYTRPAAARLPFAYNAQRTLHWFTHDKQPGYWNVCKPIKVIHFSSSPKPWEAPDKKGELELIWWQHFMAAQVGDLGVDLGAMGF